MFFEKEYSYKDFQLPVLTSAKLINARSSTVDKKKLSSQRFSSPSPRRTPISQITVSDSFAKQKHPIPPYVSAKTWAVFNTITNQIIFGQGIDDKREIASLTKIMTCYLSLQLSEKYTISLQ